MNGNSGTTRWAARCSRPPCNRARSTTSTRAGAWRRSSATPARNERLRTDWPDAVLPGFYADKRCWISVDLDNDAPEDLLRELRDHSYSFVFVKLTKKFQREITENGKPHYSRVANALICLSVGQRTLPEA